jgi:hypothetical protein
MSRSTSSGVILSGSPPLLARAARPVMTWVNWVAGMGVSASNNTLPSPSRARWFCISCRHRDMSQKRYRV